MNSSITLPTQVPGARAKIHPARLLLLLAAAAFAAHVTATMLPAELMLRNTLLDFLPVLECILASAGSFVAYRATHDQKRMQSAWLLFALGLVMYSIGETAWLIMSRVFEAIPFPSIADLFYLVYYLPFFAGVYLITPKARKQQLLHLAFDLTIIMIGCGLLFWKFLFGPAIANLSVDVGPQFIGITLAYPALDLALLWMLIALYLRDPSVTRSSTSLWPALSVAAMTIGDVLFNYATLTDTYVNGSAIDLIFSSGLLAMVVAASYAALKPALAPVADANDSAAADTGTESAADGGGIRRMVSHALPYAWMGLAYAMLIWTHNEIVVNDTSHFALISQGVGLTVALVVCRQLMSIWENGRLTERLQGQLRERAKIENALRLAKDEAEQMAQAAGAANAAKSEFLAAMSHEIRTPMNGVIGFANLLADTPLSVEQQDYLRTIKNSGESLLTLINDILDYSKIEAGKLDLEINTFDLRACCADVLELVTPLADAKKLDLTLLAHPGSIWVTGDASRVRQVLLNLVSNAVKFTDSGSVHMSVEQEDGAVALGRPVRVTITDSGIGIAPNKLPLLFQKFVQADNSTTRRFGGTGLGLAISKQLITLMGGDIGVTSTPDMGSTFWISLPAAESLALEVTQLPQPNTFANARILVVDDIEVNREILRHMLTNWRLNFDCAAGGAEALSLMHQARTEGNPYHVAILDHHMPEMSGEDLGQHIRSDATLAQTALIMFSSGLHTDARARLHAAGFSSILQKPLTRPSALFDAICACLAKNEALLVHAEAAIGAKSSPVAQPAATAPIYHILLAEDNTVNQKLARLMLEKLGCWVDLASNGVEALRLARKIRYHLVLMDCQMPEMDGFEAAAALRKLETEQPIGVHAGPVPIIALTANAMQGDRERCIEAGMSDYLTKPLRAEALAGVLDRWLTPVHASR